jgi:DNA-binding CsgD family transcriptional regulator
MDRSPPDHSPDDGVAARLTDALARDDTATAALIVRDHMYEIWSERAELLGIALMRFTEADYAAHPALALARDSAGLQASDGTSPHRLDIEAVLPTLTYAQQTQVLYLEMSLARYRREAEHSLAMGDEVRRRLVRTTRALHAPQPFDPEPVWINQLALTETLFGDTSTAIADLREADRLSTADDRDSIRADNHAKLAVLLALRGNIAEARTALTRGRPLASWQPAPHEFTARIAETAAALIATESMSPDAEEILAAADRPVNEAADELWPVLLLARGRYALAHQGAAGVLELTATAAAAGPFPEGGLTQDVIASLTGSALVELGDLTRAQEALSGERPGWFVRVARLRLLIARGAHRQFQTDARRLLTAPRAPLAQRAETTLLSAWADLLHRGGPDPGSAMQIADVARDGLIRPLTTVPRDVLTALAETLPSTRREGFEAAFASLPGHSPATALAPLTERELGVLRALAEESSITELGRQLFLSPNTVKTHLRAVYRKLGVRSRDEALDEAARLGILPSP